MTAAEHATTEAISNAHAPLLDALELQQLRQIITLLALSALPLRQWRPFCTVCVAGLLLLLLLLAELAGVLLLQAARLTHAALSQRIWHSSVPAGVYKRTADNRTPII
jgi:hypothetical protein